MLSWLLRQYFKRLLTIASLILMSSYIMETAGSTVMGIDFGSQYIKIAYAAPGEEDPLPIMLNDLSERKTLNMISFRDGKPFFGLHAIKPFLNQPESGYTWLNKMFGNRFDSVVVQELLKFTAAKFYGDDYHGRVLIRTKNDEKAPVEYLSAMLLTKLTQWTEVHSNRRVRDVVITVPPYFTQAQRQAVIDTARIAGLRVLSLTSDISSAALYYGTFSIGKAKEGRYIILFDSGATHTAASLVYIEPNHVEDKNSTTLVEVKQSVWSTELHGLSIDQVVADVLIKKFGSDVPIGKPYNRLLAEASRVKHILSANAAIKVYIEELVGDKHLSTQLSREELETACAHLRNMASKLIFDLLEESKIALDKIYAIIPIGGSSRVPFIQDDLRKAFGDKVQFILNMDETIAQGAALYAASLSHFRVKPIRFRDSYPEAVNVHYGDNLIVPIYHKFSLVDGHKGIAFKNMNSINAIVKTENRGDLLSVNINGMDEALAKMENKTVISSRLKFWVDLTTSGLIMIKDNPVALVEYEEITSEPNNTENSGKPEEPESSDKPKSSPEPQTLKIVKTSSFPLNYDTKLLYAHLEIEEIHRWIRKDEEEEREANKRSAKRNDLESHLYRLKDIVENKDFQSYAKSNELETLNSSLAAASDLLEDREESHKLEEYEESLQTLLAPEKKVQLRIDEQRCRPNSIANLRKNIEDTLSYVDQTRRDTPNPAARAQTDEDLKQLESKAEEFSAWLVDMESSQAKLSNSDDPVARCVEIEGLTRELVRLRLSIVLKKVPEKPIEHAFEANQDKTAIDESVGQESTPVDQFDEAFNVTKTVDHEFSSENKADMPPEKLEL